MIDHTPKRFRPILELPDTPLSSDLEWALSNPQIDMDTLAEVAVHSYYASLYHLAYFILDDPVTAGTIADETLVKLIRQRHDLNDYSSLDLILRKWVITASEEKLSNKTNFLKKRGILAKLTDDQSLKRSDRLTKLEILIWQSLSELNLSDQLMLLLKYIHDLDDSMIAWILNEKEDQIALQLLSARDEVQANLRHSGVAEQIDEDQIQQSLRNYWPVEEMVENENETVRRILYRLSSEVKRKRLVSCTFRVALGALALIFLALIVAVTEYLTELSEPKPRMVETIIVTQIVQVPVKPVEEKPSPAPVITPEPLNVDSSTETIRQRMVASEQGWNTLWAEGLVFQYGPLGYIGPPSIRRDQVWVSQPQYSLVLTGQVDGEVDHAWFSQSGKVYDVDLETGRPILYDYHGEQIPVYSRLEDLIFPTKFAMEAADFNVLGTEMVSRREALKLDWIAVDGTRPYRIWVDRQTGLLLRILFYESDPEIVTLEVMLTNLEINPDFPKHTFDRQKLSLEFKVVEDYDHIPPPRRQVSSVSKMEAVPERSSKPKVNPPADFDAAGNNLAFEWSKPPRISGLSSTSILGLSLGQENWEVPVDIFAEDYFLGAVVLNPWNVQCERSPDGNRIAFVTNLARAGQIVPVLRWLHLDTPNAIHNLDAKFFPEFNLAFAPDSRQLAFQSCLGVSCGIYILDTDTSEVRQIFNRRGSILSWSPDGKYLALTGTTPTQAFEGLIVLDIASEGITYFGEYDRESGDELPDSPVQDWGALARSSLQGFENCTLP